VQYSLEKLATQLEQLELCNTVAQVETLKDQLVKSSPSCRVQIKDHLNPDVVLLQYITNRRKALISHKGMAFDVMAQQYMEDRNRVLAQSHQQKQEIDNLTAQLKQVQAQLEAALKSAPVPSSASPLSASSSSSPPGGPVPVPIASAAAEENKRDKRGPPPGEVVWFRCSFCKATSCNSSFKCDDCGMVDFQVSSSGEVTTFEPIFVGGVPFVPDAPDAPDAPEMPDKPAPVIVVNRRPNGGRTGATVPKSLSPADMLAAAIKAAIAKRRGDMKEDDE